MPVAVAVPGLGALEIDRCVGTEAVRWILLWLVTSFRDTSARDPHRHFAGMSHSRYEGAIGDDSSPRDQAHRDGHRRGTLRVVDTSQFVEAVTLTLAPAMKERSFGPGGPGLSRDGSVTFLYCTGAQAFGARWPQTIDILQREQAVDLRDPSRCLDLVVEVSSAGAVVRLDFEFVDLELLLRAADLDGLAQRCSINELHGLDATAAATRIREGVEALMPLGT